MTWNLLDETLKTLPDIDTRKQYLHVNAGIVKNADFENGLVKILDKKENLLTPQESEACTGLMRAVEVDSEKDPRENKENENVPDDFASVILKKRQKLCPVTKYVDCRFLLPTSNLLERFFSTAGYASSDLRQRLLPANLEEQLFLKINKRYWDQKTVNCALSS